MARPYSVHRPERVVRAVAGGAFAAGDGSEIRGAHQLRDQADAALAGAGTLQPGRIGGGKRPTLAAPAERVQALLAAAPDLTIAELQGRLAAAGTLRPGAIVVLEYLGAPKVKGGARGDRGRGREAPLPAALQPRSAPDRARLRHAQRAAAHRRQVHRRGAVAGPQPCPRRLHPGRMLPLSPTPAMCHLIGKGF
jgi:hypothetical protein